MKKILFVITSMGGGGAERNVSLLANEFAAQGHQVEIGFLFSHKVSYELDQKIKLMDFIPPTGFKFVKKIKFWQAAISKECSAENIDVVIGVGIKYGLICSYALSSNKKAKLIVRGTSSYRLSFFEKAAAFCFGRRINTFVCQTKSQSFFLPTSLRKKSLVISNPFKTYTTNNNQLGFQSKRLVCVGRLDLLNKKQDVILEAFSQLSSSNFKSFTLSFYGDDSDGGKTAMKLRQIADEKGLRNVVFHPFTNSVGSEIKNSYAFVCCSRVEGMPNALIEALMIGIPAVSSDWAGSDEVVVNGINGFVFKDCNDVSALKAALEAICSLSKEEYVKMSDNAWKHLSERYDSKNVFEKWLSLL